MPTFGGFWNWLGWFILVSVVVGGFCTCWYNLCVVFLHTFSEKD